MLVSEEPFADAAMHRLFYWYPVKEYGQLTDRYFPLKQTVILSGIRYRAHQVPSDFLLFASRSNNKFASSQRDSKVYKKDITNRINSIISGLDNFLGHKLGKSMEEIIAMLNFQTTAGHGFR